MLNKIKTGVPGLDMMLHGGLIPNRPYIVAGVPGSGKTTLCMHFLLEGARNNESVLIVALDEPPNEIKENMQSFGWDVSGVRILDGTPDVKGYQKKSSVKDIAAAMDVKGMKEISEIRKSHMLRQLEINITAVLQMLKQEMREYLEITGNRYSRVVIDSMTALKMFSMRGEEERINIQSFLRFLCEAEVTALIVSDVTNGYELGAEDMLARGDIRLHRWREVNILKRGISIERYRGSDHDLTLRPMEITNNGIVVYPDRVMEPEVLRKEETPVATTVAAKKPRPPTQKKKKTKPKIKEGVSLSDKDLNKFLRRDILESDNPAI
jgi:KaiC/GvpD/RAD55 family RecA-like ATPase